MMMTWSQVQGSLAVEETPRPFRWGGRIRVLDIDGTAGLKENGVPRVNFPLGEGVV